MTGTTSFGIDIGGSGMKAGPVDLATGKLTAERFKILTPSPSSPDNMADVVVKLVKHFDWHGPVGVTFPGVVRRGVVHTRRQRRQARGSTSTPTPCSPRPWVVMSRCTSSTTPTPPGSPR